MLVPRNILKKSDAIVVLTGNGWERTDFGVELFKQGWAPQIVMVGSTGSRPPKEMAKRAKSFGIQKEKIIIADKSSNTKQNAYEILALARQNSWTKIILVTSPHHQLRAHLTFQKTWKKQEGQVEIINFPPEKYSWFELVESSRDKNKKFLRLELLVTELYQIVKYRFKGDL